MLKITEKLLAFFLLIICISCSKDDNETITPVDPPTTTPPTKGETFWWNEGVFYEIFVRSFYDSNGDGIGDLQGLIQKLDYLNDGNPNTHTDLGVKGIWLMPINQSPSYHGYNVINYREVNSEYGTNEDFKMLMEEAHNRGIKVIIDLVINHTSSQHPWFDLSKSGDMDLRNWYLWSTNKPSYSGPWGQDVWHRYGDSYYYGVFWSGMPDLNFDNEEVKTEIKDIANFWLEEMNVDGFRLDAAKHIVENGSTQENTQGTLDWWTEFNQSYKSTKPEALAVGEVWDQTNIVLSYLDNRLDFCFEFDLASDILSSVNNSNPNSIAQKMEELNTLYPYHQYGTFLTNHDQNRTIGSLSNNVNKNKLAASVYLTLPGIPFIYYGEEIAMRGQKPDEDIRRPMLWNANTNAGFSTGLPWRTIDNNYTSFNVATLQADQNSIWTRYNKLVQARNRESALSVGTFQVVQSSEDEIYAYLRYDNENAILVVHNFGETLEDFKLTLETTLVEEGRYNTVNLLSDQMHSQISINQYGGFIDYQIAELDQYESLLLKLQ
jgi:glycosidase